MNFTKLNKFREIGSVLDLKLLGIVLLSLVLTFSFLLSGLTSAVGSEAFSLSSNGEEKIKILNKQSYPELGGNWTVGFETHGEADLEITPVNGTSWFSRNREPETYDLKFIDLRCGDKEIDYEWVRKRSGKYSVLIQNYSCEKKSYEESRVLTSGKHHLKFRFGDDLDYAHNTQDDNPPNYYNETTSPLSPTVYSPGDVYQFNISWNDSETVVDDVKFQFNGTNYTYSGTTDCPVGGNRTITENCTFEKGDFSYDVLTINSTVNISTYANVTANETIVNGHLNVEGHICVGSNCTFYEKGDITNVNEEYYINLSDLSVGNYPYRWYASDTQSNSNSTPIFFYIVKEHTPTNLTVRISLPSGENVVMNGNVNPSEGEYSNQGFGYVVTKNKNLLTGLVGEKVLKMRFSNSSGKYNLSAMSDVGNRIFVPFYNGDYYDIKNRESLIESRKFLEEIEPNFGRPFPDEMLVRLYLPLKDINLTEDLHVGSGYHNLYIQNEGGGRISFNLTQR